MSTERWVSLKDRAVIMHEENDGWTFLRHGAEEREEETTLGKLAAEHPNHLVSLIMEELRAHHRIEHKVENWQSLGYAARSKALSEVEDYCTERLEVLATEMDRIGRMRAAFQTKSPAPNPPASRP